MPITLSHTTALEYYRQTSAACHQPALSHARTHISQPPKCDLDTVSFARPLHVLVANEETRRNSKNFFCHIWSRALPKGYILNVDAQFAVVSPELCFVQMAEILPQIELIQLGYELCGMYRVSTNTRYHCEPLTSKKKLKAFISKAHYIRGLRKASGALRHIVENSASPMETNLTMLLCLPYRLGGFGIEQPFLNYKVNSSSQHYFCDLYWPRVKLAIEYDSDMFHVGADRITHDSIRRGNLSIQGIQVISVTRGQVMRRTEFEKIAYLVAKLTSKRLQYSPSDFLPTNIALRATLFSRKDTGKYNLRTKI